MQRQELQKSGLKEETPPAPKETAPAKVTGEMLGQLPAPKTAFAR